MPSELDMVRRKGWAALACAKVLGLRSWVAVRASMLGVMVPPDGGRDEKRKIKRKIGGNNHPHHIKDKMVMLHSCTPRWFVWGCSCCGRALDARRA